MSNFFKFHNIQLQHSTRQNTTFSKEGTVEEQFKNIQKDSRQEALNELEAQKLLTPQQIQDVKVQDSQPDMTTEGDLEEQPPIHTSPSSSDPSSFEVIDTIGDYDRTHAVPREPEQRLNPPSSLPQLDDLFTDDESNDEVPVTQQKGTSDSDCKLITQVDVTNDQSKSSKKSAIEANDEDEEDEDTVSVIGLKDRCDEVDLKISSRGYHSTKPEILQLLPDLYKKGLNIDNFLNLKDYLEQAVGPLPTDSFLRNALDYLFQDYPHLQTIQENVYSIIKLFLSETKHPDVNQFQDISLQFDSVSGDKVPVKELLSHKTHIDDSPDLLDSDQPLDLTYTHNDDTFYTMDSHDLADQLGRVQSVYCTSSCPSLDKGMKYKPQVPPYPTEGVSQKVTSEGETTECIHHDKGDPLKPEDTDNPPRVSTPIETTCKNPLSERLH